MLCCAVLRADKGLRKEARKNKKNRQWFETLPTNKTKGKHQNNKAKQANKQ